MFTCDARGVMKDIQSFCLLSIASSHSSSTVNGGLCEIHCRNCGSFIIISQTVEAR